MIANGWRSDDPCVRINSLEGEWHARTDQEIAAYQATWPIGPATRRHPTPPRWLALHRL
jgi:hypothetical protein